VDIGQEVSAMRLDVRFDEANLKTVQAADEMLATLLKIRT
jgi:flagellar basal body rod protein FlgG